MNQTASVRGDAALSACLRKAGLLAIHVYNNDAAHVAPALREAFQSVEANWDIAWDDGVSASPNDPDYKQQQAVLLGGAVEHGIRVLEGDSGLYARLYTPKIPDGLGPEDVCPPVLAFRGSEQKDEEFRDLAATLTVVIDFMEQPLLGGDGTTTRAAFFLRLDPFAGWEERTVARASGQPVDHGPLADLILRTYVSGSVVNPVGDALPAEVLAAQAAIDLPETQALLNAERDIRVGFLHNNRLRARATLTAHYDSHGDWAANIYQGMGRVGDQYNRVKDLVDRAAAAAMENWNGRLNITGHSLGGGLAAAAALYARTTYPDLILGAITYNAAGLHDQTIKEVGETTRSTASDIPIHGKVVKDEILHSLGVRGLIPFVSDIFRWQNKFMPEPTGVTDVRVGLSPGPFPVGAPPRTQLYLADDGWRLPQLWPLEQQTMFTEPYVVRYQVPQGLAVGSGGTGPRGYEPNALDSISDRAARTSPDWGQLQALSRLERPSSDIMRVRRIAHLAGLFRRAATFDDALDAAVRYALQEAWSAFDLDIGQLVADDSNWRTILPGLSRLLDEIAAEGEILAALFAASAAYHPMDVAGSTFLRDITF